MRTPQTRPTEPGRSRIPVDAVTRLFISLLIALLLWGWVTTQRNPTQSRTIAEVPIAAPQLPDADLQIGGELGTVTLQLEGPQSVVEGIVRTDLEPMLDLSGVSAPGEHTVPVVVSLPPAVRIDRIDPPRLSIVVDERAVRTVPLEVEREEPDDGTRRFGEITPVVSEVTVEGPRRLVDQVERVVLPVEMGERTADFTAQLAPVALAAGDQPIPEVEVRPRRVLTTVEVEARGRSVPVLIQTVGSPAPGYELGDDAVDPGSVLIDGPPEVLASMVSVLTEPVSVDGATASISTRVALTGLPMEVGVVEPADGQVTVVIQVRQRGVTQSLAEQPVLVTGVGPGLEAIVQPRAVSVVVVAAEDALATLRAGDVTPRASVDGLTAGIHQVPLTVAVPSGVQWIRAEPAAVRVTLRPVAPTPPAEATPEEGERREMP
jgi:YbbR domain-containing protein